MIQLKTPAEIEIMEKGGGILSRILTEVVKKARPGIATLELDQLADTLIKKNGALASFKRVKNYHWATCICVNDTVVHGIPKKEEKLNSGDIVGIDIGLYCQGFHTDISTSVIIGETPEEPKKQFLRTGIEALNQAIKTASPGKHIGDISRAIQTTVEEAGYEVVRELVGHGIGRDLHEDPQLPGWLTVGKKIEDTPRLEVGMTLAIEIIYAMGKGDIIYKNSDGWTIGTRDNSLAGLFEKTIAITQEGPKILTPYNDRIL